MVEFLVFNSIYLKGVPSDAGKVLGDVLVFGGTHDLPDEECFIRLKNLGKTGMCPHTLKKNCQVHDEMLNSARVTNTKIIEF